MGCTFFGGAGVVRGSPEPLKDPRKPNRAKIP